MDPENPEPLAPRPYGEASLFPTPSWERFPLLVHSPSAWQAWGRHALLFVLTALSVFTTEGLKIGPTGAIGLDVPAGLKLVAGLMSILLAHEMGHYLYCRRYGVDATLPFFIPAPAISLVGTLGAFIRIRGRIPHRRALFDIGIAGPLAGFAVCLPVLFLGIREATLVPVDRAAQGIFLGEPLLFQWAARWLRGPLPDSMTLTLGPLGLAAWFGLLVTALNMIPIGQLDGGHVVYALIRERALLVSRIGSWICILLIYFGPNWLFWSILLRILGRRHPPTSNDYAPLGRARVAVGLVGFAVFAVCFVPDPIVWSWKDAFEAIRLSF